MLRQDKEDFWCLMFPLSKETKETVNNHDSMRIIEMIS